MGFWSGLGKIASVAAPIAAAPFTAGTSLAWLGPALAQGAGALGAMYAGKGATSSAMQRSPEELEALRGAQGIAGAARGTGDQLIGQGKDLFGQGASLTKQGINYLQQPANYYQTLLSGNRAAMSGAIAPQVAQMTANYRGAGRALEHSGIRGAARDVASADLNRQRVSQIAGLTTGVQPAAANALAGLSQQAISAASPLYGAGAAVTGQGAGLYGTAGNIYGNLLRAGTENRQYGRLEGEKTSAALGGLVRDIGEAVYGSTKGKTSAPKPQYAGSQAGIPGGKLPGQQIGMPQIPSFGGQQAGLRFPGTVAPWLGTGQETGTPDWFKTARF